LGRQLQGEPWGRQFQGEPFGRQIQSPRRQGLMRRRRAANGRLGMINSSSSGSPLPRDRPTAFLNLFWDKFTP
jgi:hypothetical protein